jgi:hypothetical protein
MARLITIDINKITHPGQIGPELSQKLNLYAGAGGRRGSGTSPLMTDSRGGGRDPANVGATMNALNSITSGNSSSQSPEGNAEAAQQRQPEPTEPGGQEHAGGTTDEPPETMQPEDVHNDTQFAGHMPSAPRPPRFPYAMGAKTAEDTGSSPGISSAGFPPPG